MKNVCIFEPRYHYNSHHSVYSNNSCFDNPVGQASSSWNGAGTGIAASRPGLFIFTNAIPHYAHRNHATAPTPTRQNDAHTTPATISQAQQPTPKTSISNNAFGKVLTLAAIWLAAFSTLIF